MKAETEGLTQKEFNDRMNDPEYYQFEAPANNRSHKYEYEKGTFAQDDPENYKAYLEVMKDEEGLVTDINYDELTDEQIMELQAQAEQYDNEFLEGTSKTSMETTEVSETGEVTITEETEFDDSPALGNYDDLESAGGSKEGISTAEETGEFDDTPAVGDYDNLESTESTESAEGSESTESSDDGDTE